MISMNQISFKNNLCYIDILMRIIYLLFVYLNVQVESNKFWLTRVSLAEAKNNYQMGHKNIVFLLKKIILKKALYSFF